MRSPHCVPALFAALGLAACGSAVSPGKTVTFEFDFASGPQSWEAGFAEYPTGQDAFHELEADYRPLPESLAPGRSALYISGNNHSDDLFMFYKRRVEGLVARARYDARLDLEIATDVPTGCGGVGGSPGESVYVKAGAGENEPTTTIDASGAVQLAGFDKGNQAVGGRHAIVLGDVANSQPCEVVDGAIVSRWEFKTLRSPQTVGVRADAQGGVWLLVGTDSGFEATTSLFYTRVTATLRPAGN